MIHYVEFSVALHNIAEDESLEDVRRRLEEAVREHVHPNAEMDSDITVCFNESA